MYKTNFEILLLSLNRNKFHLPEDILNLIYYYQLESLPLTTKTQFQMSCSTRFSLHYMRDIKDMWTRQEPFAEFIANHISYDDRIYLWNSLMKCQCCKRHYNTSYNFGNASLGEPYYNGTKNENYNDINYLSKFKFKRFGTHCNCKCRHLRRWIERTINT